MNLTRRVKIHICKDRTLSFRTVDQPIFNGVAIPVASVETFKDARDLLILVGTRQYGNHPQMPESPGWFKLFNGLAEGRQYLEYGDLEEISEYLEQKYQGMILGRDKVGSEWE